MNLDGQTYDSLTAHFAWRIPDAITSASTYAINGPTVRAASR